MSSPSTNWRPISRIARPTAVRITGSPSRLTMPRSRPGEPRLRVVVEHLAGQHQRPGRGVDQRRGRLAQMLAPVRRRDLVLDQRVDGGRPSGTRSSASARHISATPSSVDSPYSARNTSIRPGVRAPIDQIWRYTWTLISSRMEMWTIWIAMTAAILADPCDGGPDRYHGACAADRPVQDALPGPRAETGGGGVSSTGYRAVLDPGKLGLGHVTFVEVRLGDTREDALQGVQRGGSQGSGDRAMPHDRRGVRLPLESAQPRYRRLPPRVLGEVISALPHVASTSTHVSMEAVKDLSDPA
jgi:hypothetical protein